MSHCMIRKSEGFLSASWSSSGVLERERVTTFAVNFVSNISATARPIPLVKVFFYQ